ncbi:MAG: tRNA (guanine-N(7)-)-methyltransferase [Chlamydiae bacterium]|nr:tRNA (guanine-N(7)-)-methyltransferase [Chlamydiota bacterium]
MRPKDLKFPFKWEERRPALYEGVLIVPQYYNKHDEWEGSLFSSGKPLSIEYCSGNGDWIIEKAKGNPDKFWVAVEKQFERVRKIWSKMHNEEINNLLIVCGEAQTFTRHYLPDAIAEEVFVNFPDPWPKDRHAKHRLIQSPFVRELARVVRKEGTATFVTDHTDYSAQMIEVMQKNSGWKALYPDPYYSNSLEDYGSSWFETLWKRKGRSFYLLQFARLSP